MTETATALQDAAMTTWRMKNARKNATIPNASGTMANVRNARQTYPSTARFLAQVLHVSMTMDRCLVHFRKSVRRNAAMVEAGRRRTLLFWILNHLQSPMLLERTLFGRKSCLTHWWKMTRSCGSKLMLLGYT